MKIVSTEFFRYSILKNERKKSGSTPSLIFWSYRPQQLLFQVVPNYIWSVSFFTNQRVSFRQKGIVQHGKVNTLLVNEPSSNHEKCLYHCGHRNNLAPNFMVRIV